MIVGCGVMSMNFKKNYLMNETYKDKNALKHKHNYSIKYLLIVTNINTHASAGLYNSKEYFCVLKCDKCNSFIPDSVEGNYSHYASKDEINDRSLPVITASTIQKQPHYNFCKLLDVEI